MAMGLSSGSGASEHIQMDALAYSSRMLNWAPLGKLLLVIVVLIANVMTDSVVTAWPSASP